MRVNKGKHMKTPQSKPQGRHRMKDLHKIAAEAGLMVEGVSEDDLGDHGGAEGSAEGSAEGGAEGGDTVAKEVIDTMGVIDAPPLQVMAVPLPPSPRLVTAQNTHPIGSDWQDDATELQNFFDSLPNEGERAMMHSDPSDALF